MSADRVLAFDIGIKNLAYAVLDLSTMTVVALENVNLLDPVEPIRCTGCAAKASFTASELPYCRRHLPKTHTIQPAWKATKAPTNKQLREWVTERGLTATGTSNDAYRTALSAVLAIPLQQPKQANASRVSLETLHQAIYEMVYRQNDLFVECRAILLENQPAFKNPHMKSVQVLLFSILREAALRSSRLFMPSFHFVHAAKKSKGATKGDAGYAERKNTSEKRVTEAFQQGVVHGPEWYASWTAASKKSDMADALCMCMDYASSYTPTVAT